ncbi:hypothetical protein [Oryzifoliimicrobium ureilyticus]|uniref:hypothetical protein n=1 Tax=Oryzifoliimicrobium ureilyticus TaxID=3113724 RepID=UPI0030762AF7
MSQTQSPVSPGSTEQVLEVELNALGQLQNGCAATFVLTNRLGAPIRKVSYELAFFNDKNVVDKITTIDFGEIPQDKTRVRKFNLPNVTCAGVKRIVVNDAPACDGPSARACLDMLRTRSQVSVPFEG